MPNLRNNMSSMPYLYIFGGLPACGKTSVATALARETGACQRIDTLEQALIRVGLCAADKLDGKGYEIACELARDQLANGVSVIADCVNPLDLTREWWRSIAGSVPCVALEVEFVCSDAVLHRTRAENRVCDITDMVQPDWEAIQQRKYEVRAGDHCTVDTARLSISEAVKLILKYKDDRQI